MATCKSGCNSLYVAEVAIKPWIDCCATPIAADVPWEIMADLNQFDFTIATTAITQKNTRYRGGGNSNSTSKITALNFTAIFTCLTKSIMGSMLLGNPATVVAGTAVPFTRKFLNKDETYYLPDLYKPGSVLITGLVSGTDFKETINGGGIQLLGTAAVQAMVTAGTAIAHTYDRDAQTDVQIGNRLTSYFKIWVQGVDEYGVRTNYFFNKVALTASGAVNTITQGDQYQTFSVAGAGENDTCADLTTLVAGQKPSGWGSVRTGLTA
jgi:hypothetical protein